MVAANESAPPVAAGESAPKTVAAGESAPVEAGVNRPRRKDAKYKLPTALVNDEVPALGGSESVALVEYSEVTRGINNNERKAPPVDANIGSAVVDNADPSSKKMN